MGDLVERWRAKTPPLTHLTPFDEWAFYHNKSGEPIGCYPAHIAAKIAFEAKAAIDKAEIERLREALAKIKTEVCGDKYPNWTDTVATTETRMRIADVCDRVLSNN